MVSGSLLIARYLYLVANLWNSNTERSSAAGDESEVRILGYSTRGGVIYWQAIECVLVKRGRLLVRDKHDEITTCLENALGPSNVTRIYVPQMKQSSVHSHGVSELVAYSAWAAKGGNKCYLEK